MKNKIKKLCTSELSRIIASLVFFVTGLIFGAINVSSVAITSYILALIAAGIDVFCDAVKGILRRDPLDEKFLMSIAAIGAMILGEWSEGAAVMIFYLIGESFEHRAVRRSRASIRALMDICPDEARVLIDEKEVMIDAEDVEIGATVVIRPGERVPVDCTVLSGNASVDTSSMTGEPLPVSVGEGDFLAAGYVVSDGLIYAVAKRPADESAAARVISLVEFASDNKSVEESFITRFSRYYTPVVVALAVIVASLPPILGLSTLSESIYTALTFLVISCPCALVISVPMAFFGGIGGAASRGILFKGGNVFSKLAKCETAVFDKTGTITSGRFNIDEVTAIGISKDELLKIAASLESVSNHPIAECISRSSDEVTPPSDVAELAGLGVVATLDFARCAVGNLSLMEKESVEIPSELLRTGAVYVARNSLLVGVITLSDKLKPEARSAISSLRSLGVRRTVILSGDREDNVRRIADEVGINEAYHSLTPEMKYSNLEKIISESSSTAYVGDGINDAPSLARADIGIAMGSLGQDIAIEASDVVIMTDDLKKLSESMLIARKTVAIARENIVFALGVKGMVLLLGFLGLANMWLAVFADVGVAVLAVLNAMRALKAPRLK